ncbi:hypothetical protein J7T55_001719 [Diaporthe amygdali]|uniref:uncharacterized protein n=1 Tax=Phomopsis amygdali TaxID=1214568 RepID=UPI0022FE3260|nr:uncharacterized protein J7T55_001719 [Diaporthe amygdali]KAJ0104232.1 hypothetical protein J7T55_001719 [Diaporthe amygdali]
MRFPLLALLADAATVASALRYVMYYDQYHNLSLPDPSIVSEVTHAVVAFAPCDTFLDNANSSSWQPFETVQSVKTRFSSKAKICLSIGGWGSNTGFEKGSIPANQASYANNIASVVQRLGFDCVDIDWEYPGGGGADYKLGNAASSSEEQIKNYPSFLGAIKGAVGNGKELSIAVPGLEADMGAFTPAVCQAIVPNIDFVNVMSYDLMNRRSSKTQHHASVTGCKQSMSVYIKNGIPAAKLNVGFPFYAKWFTLQADAKCENPIGCSVEGFENADGSDNGLSGIFTFENFNLGRPPSSVSTSINGRCGSVDGIHLKCPDANCCSSSMYCGTGKEYCGSGCLSGYGLCTAPVTTETFQRVYQSGQSDDTNGGQWYIDKRTNTFWTWDTPSHIGRKFTDVVAGLQLGGIMAWSFGEDSYDYAHVKALQTGYKGTQARAKRRNFKGDAAVVARRSDL